MRETNYFNDPVYISWRAGTEEDPYKSFEETMPIDKQRIVLTEIPDEFTSVIVEGFTEIKDGIPKKGQFKVTYANGVINFNQADNNQSVRVRYKGRGVILYPASRIYYHRGNVVETLDELIETVGESIDEIEQVKQEQLQLIEETETVKQETAQVRDRAETAAENAEEAYETTILVWKGFVDNMDNIDDLYPNPDIGWTVQELSGFGSRYRFNGDYWVEIDRLTPVVPDVSETNDGLMLKEDYQKLKELSLSNNDKQLQFVMNYSIPSGHQDIIARFPFNGTIKELDGICENINTDRAFLNIEKISKDDYINGNDTWQPIFNEDFEFNETKKHVNITDNFAITQVNKDDYFRVNVQQTTENLSGINMQLSIEI